MGWIVSKKNIKIYKKKKINQTHSTDDNAYFYLVINVIRLIP